MDKIAAPFITPRKSSHIEDGRFSAEEVRLANRNHGALLELLRLDVTPTGGHYLLNHFDVPILDTERHRLRFHGAFERPFEISLAEIMAEPTVTMPVTLECAGNGRSGVTPRSYSMPWMVEAVGTSIWMGTLLMPLLDRAGLREEVVEVSFTGADFGFDKAVGHPFGRALTVDQLRDLEVLLVWGMNGQPLLPQHGAPLRIIVPGWYGMASVKWLTSIEALTETYSGYQQMQTYRLRQDANDYPGKAITTMRVRSLMVPPGAPDWMTRRRVLEPGPVEVMGRAWSGGGVPIARVALGVDDDWVEADVTPGAGPYAWSKWAVNWEATPGSYVLRCRAWDAEGNAQPLTPPWDNAGFCNNAPHEVEVYVGKS